MIPMSEVCIVAIRIDIQRLSVTYRIRRLTCDDTEEILALYLGNPMYYRYCPPPPTRESIVEDLLGLPPGKTPDDKYYLGYFSKNRLIAVIDLISGYPEAEIAFIGLFMMSEDFRGQGIGSSIIGELAAYLEAEGFSSIRLAVAKGNLQSESYWHKNHFVPTGMESVRDSYTAVVMERPLEGGTSSKGHRSNA